MCAQVERVLWTIGLKKKREKDTPPCSAPVHSSSSAGIIPHNKRETKKNKNNFLGKKKKLNRVWVCYRLFIFDISNLFDTKCGLPGQRLKETQKKNVYIGVCFFHKPHRPFPHALLTFSASLSVFPCATLFALKWHKHRMRVYCVCCFLLRYVKKKNRKMDREQKNANFFWTANKNNIKF